MVHLGLERHFLRELLHITLSALLSEFQAQNWFKNLLARVLGWLESCLSWQGIVIIILI